MNLRAAVGASPSVLSRGTRASASSHYKQLFLQHLAQCHPEPGLGTILPAGNLPRAGLQKPFIQ
jgi:hypothetical protein